MEQQISLFCYVSMKLFFFYFISHAAASGLSITLVCDANTINDNVPICLLGPRTGVSA